MEEFVSVQEAAQRKGVSVSAIYRAIREGRLSATLILGRKALRVADVDAFDFGSYTIPGHKRQERARLPRGANKKRP